MRWGMFSSAQMLTYPFLIFAGTALLEFRSSSWQNWCLTHTHIFSRVQKLSTHCRLALCGGFVIKPGLLSHLGPRFSFLVDVLRSCYVSRYCPFLTIPSILWRADISVSPVTQKWRFMSPDWWVTLISFFSFFRVPVSSLQSDLFTHVGLRFMADNDAQSASSPGALLLVWG